MNDPAAISSIAPRFHHCGEGELFSIETVVSLTRTPRHRIAVYCRHGLVSPRGEPAQGGWWFDLEAIRTLRRLEYLRITLELNHAGLLALGSLLSEVERLREELRSLGRG